jgi:hypothetical protein
LTGVNLAALNKEAPGAMNLHTLTTAGTLAFAAALMFLVSARAWHALTRVTTGAPVFQDSTMREAAQRFRDETERLGRNHAAYLAATLVSSIIFATALGFDLDGLYRGYPTWQLSLVVALLASFGAFVLFKLATTLSKLAAARFQRDASIAIGHQLLRFATAHGSVFHDVDAGQNIVDHVLVGHDGAYAIHVIAARNRGRRAARLSGEELHLGNTSHSLERLTNNAHHLSAAFSKLAGHKVPVRSVVAIPGWDVDSQQGNKHLLVNERTLPMLTGWKSRSDYLMNEDVAAIVEYLTDRGKRR